MVRRQTILAVGGDADTRDSVRAALEEAGSVSTAGSVDSAFETYRQWPPHAVIAAAFSRIAPEDSVDG